MKNYFKFDKKAYFDFDTNIEDIKKYNFKQNKKNFEKLVDQVFNTPKVSLESTREVVRNRELIKTRN